MVRLRLVVVVIVTKTLWLLNHILDTSNTGCFIADEMMMRLYDDDDDDEASVPVIEGPSLPCMMQLF
jgi:hypothetical protein